MTRLFPGCVLLLLAGCVSLPDEPPVPDLVQKINSDSGIQRTLPSYGQDDSFWWTELQDITLNRLVDEALKSNPSVQIALARLAQAEAGLNVAKSTRWPTLAGIGNRTARNISGSENDTRSNLGAIELSWDAGLWGKRRLQIEDARQYKDQRWFEHQLAELTLVSSIIETYYATVEQRRQGSLLSAQQKVSVDFEQLIEARFRRGQASASELYQQRESTQILNQLKLISDTNLQVLEKSLDILVGKAPDSSPRVQQYSIPQELPSIKTGRPEDLIRFRADIRAGYARLQQAAAAAGIRFTERLPSLQVSANLTSLSEKAMSTEWFGHAIDLAVPIFTAGRLRGLEEQALHTLEEERQRYLQLWLSALEEVDSLNWQFQQQQRIIETLQKRRDFAQKALSAARNRYVLGDQNYLDVLTALRGLQDADRLLITEQHLLITLWVQTMEAVGQPMCHDDTCVEQWQL